MPRKTLPYKEGDSFAVPLKDGGYALGLAARVSRSGGILGYFFGPRHETVPREEDTQGLSSRDAIFVGRFGDLGLLRDEWPIVYKPTEWRRDAWPTLTLRFFRSRSRQLPHRLNNATPYKPPAPTHRDPPATVLPCGAHRRVPVPGSGGAQRKPA